MEIEVLTETETQMELIIHGEGHSLVNLLRSYLEEDEHVTFAAYNIAHPLLDNTRPRLEIRTDGTKTPRQALVEANELLHAQVTEFKQAI
ncbi:MAG TPA: DNA-directed RNA polymerase subunit L [Methanomicrobia archaeon]|nr:DNA-directed RNA polymerase subunit L [Methanomicrobia archaeon]